MSLGVHVIEIYTSVVQFFLLRRSNAEMLPKVEKNKNAGTTLCSTIWSDVSPRTGIFTTCPQVWSCQGVYLDSVGQEGDSAVS